MNTVQSAYAKADNSLGQLLTQLDTFYQELPEPVRRAFDNLGSTVKWGCHCCLEEGQEPDGCVLDEGRPQDCVYAKIWTTKHLCQHWQPIQPSLPTQSDPATYDPTPYMWLHLDSHGNVLGEQREPIPQERLAPGDRVETLHVKRV